MKEFDHKWEDGLIVVWEEGSSEFIEFGPVLDHHQKPNRFADNPDDFYGYVDWHLIVEYKTDGWNDQDTSAAMEYAATYIDESELVQDQYEL